MNSCSENGGGVQEGDYFDQGTRLGNGLEERVSPGGMAHRICYRLLARLATGTKATGFCSDFS